MTNQEKDTWQNTPPLVKTARARGTAEKLPGHGGTGWAALRNREGHRPLSIKQEPGPGMGDTPQSGAGHSHPVLGELQMT